MENKISENVRPSFINCLLSVVTFARNCLKETVFIREHKIFMSESK
jgi:hypothetical protein